MALNSSSSLTTAKIRRFFEPYKLCDCKHIHTVQAPSLQTRLLRGSLLRVEIKNEISQGVFWESRMRMRVKGEFSQKNWESRLKMRQEFYSRVSISRLRWESRRHLLKTKNIILSPIKQIRFKHCSAYMFCVSFKLTFLSCGSRQNVNANS